MGEKKITTYFAPLEGITGYAYRKVHQELFQSPDCYYSPFLSPTQNRVFTPREKREVLPENNNGVRVVPQLMTNKADDFIWAAGELAAMGYEEVNLNLGCPSGTVVAKKKGSGFLTMPEELDRFFEQVFEQVSIGVTVKTRLGKNDPEEFHRLLDIYNKYPIRLLIIHPRVQADYYKNRPNLEMFREALAASKNPVCYNGNLFTAADYRRFTEEFPDCEHVMIGRGMVANPAFLEGLGGTPRNREQLKEFHDRILEEYRQVISGDRNLLYKMKELWFYMIRTFGDGDGDREKLEKRLRKSQRMAEYEEVVDRVFAELSLPEEYELGL